MGKNCGSLDTQRNLFPPLALHPGVKNHRNELRERQAVILAYPDELLFDPLFVFGQSDLNVNR